MRLRFCLLLGTLTLLSCNLFAGRVDENLARQIAVNWYRHYAPQSKKQAVITKTIPYKYKGRECFHIFSFDKGGFVLVSANDALTPVLGYGFDHPVPDTITNEAVKGWFDNYARQIDTAFVMNLQQDASGSTWDEILENRIPNSSGNAVGPLLTTTWDQGWPYNAMCPLNSNGPGGHSQAGCVAIALAQIMKYHAWPRRGAGKLSYISNFLDTITVNFSQQGYSWDSMPNSITTYNENAAKLIFNSGASVGSQYRSNTTSVYGSFSYNLGDGRIQTKLAMEIALTCFFRNNYDSTKAFIKIYDSDWIAYLKTEIDKLRPIYYQGTDTTINTGHAWVCDGYNDIDFFHFNFGWSGYGNGFYSVSNINPIGYNFNYAQIAISGIEPDSNTLYIDADTTFSGIQTLSSNIIISRGQTLTLTPGSQIRMAAGKGIFSLGLIKSLGILSNPVIISAADTMARWKGISYNDNYLSGYNVIAISDSNIFRNTEISYSSADGLVLRGFWERSAGLVIDNCYFKKNLGKGLISGTKLNLTNTLFLNDNLDIYGINHNNKIDNNVFKGTYIMISAAVGEFNNNKVLDNSTLIFNGCHWGPFNFIKNFFYGNNNAISCDMSAGIFINNLFVNNNIAFSSNRSYGMKIINNTFSNNITGIELSNSEYDTLYNNIIYENNNNLILNGYTTPKLSHCLLQHGLNGIINQTPIQTSQLNLDSIFDGNPDFINPSPTLGFDTTSISNYSWNLENESAALDIASNTLGFSLPTTDLDSNPRINRILDLGSYESLNSPSPSPVVISSPKSQMACETSNIILSTYIRGDSLIYEWYANSSAIPMSNNDSLVINSITIVDSGNYYCIACNSHGCDTTNIAHIQILQLPPVDIGDIQGPDTITWWQKSINYCVNNQPNTSYKFDIIGHVTATSMNCRSFMATYTDSSGIIKVIANNACGETDSTQKAVIVRRFSPPEPYGMLYGPSVVCRNQTILYYLDVGNYDIVQDYSPPIGFDWIWENLYVGVKYHVNAFALSQSVFKARWQHRTNMFRGEYINLPVTVVDLESQLPIILGPSSISTIPGLIIYSIDSLLPAISYEWVLPTGLIPSGNVIGRTIKCAVTTTFTGGTIKVRGINPNWRGPYYEKNISLAVNIIPVQLNLTSDTIITNGHQVCFNAFQTITVAGNGTSFVVQPGGSATMIAGQNIVYYPTTTVQSGGYLWGYIAPSGPWCQTPSMPAVAMAEDEIPRSIQQSSFKVYPNPTTGNFILELTGESPADKVSVDIYGVWGEKVISTALNGERIHEFSLSDKPVGVYFIRVVSGDKAETVKIIKQ